jgi:hypothetical protein
MTDQDSRHEIVIDNYTYTHTGSLPVFGCWSNVSQYQDPSGQLWAIKVLNPSDIAELQRKSRKQSLEDVLLNEAIPLDAVQTNVVPRKIERDNQERLYIAMPYYEKFLDQELRESDKNFRRSFQNNGLSLDEVTSLSLGIAKGLDYLHTRRRKAHLDLKPANIAIDEYGNPLITDFGTSSGVPLPELDDLAPRGDVYTRAPEVFNLEKEEYKSLGNFNQRADVWSFGSLMYRFFTGKYFLEGELDSTEDHRGYFESLTDRMKKEIVTSKLKNVPKRFRKFLGRCLSFDMNERFSDSGEMHSSLDNVVEKLNNWNIAKQYARKYMYPSNMIAAGLTFAGLFLYSVVTHEPTDLTLPRPASQGYDTIELPDRMQLEWEPDIELPPTQDIDVDELTIKRATEYKYAASLLKSYMQTIEHLRIGGHNNIYTNEQEDVWFALVHESQRRDIPVRNYSIVAKNIEYGLSKSETPEGKADLGDALTIARVGLDAWNKAKRASGSFEFPEYIYAQYPNGEPIIPQGERFFLKVWLAYTNELPRE